MTTIISCRWRVPAPAKRSCVRSEAGAEVRSVRKDRTRTKRAALARRYRMRGELALRASQGDRREPEGNNTRPESYAVDARHLLPRKRYPPGRDRPPRARPRWVVGGGGARGAAGKQQRKATTETKQAGQQEETTTHKKRKNSANPE